MAVLLECVTENVSWVNGKSGEQCSVVPENPAQ
jgi:hypothetical protein